MNKNISHPSNFQASLILLWFSHLFMDFCSGIWPIYKTLTGIDIAKAGVIAGFSGFFGELMQIVFGYLCDQGYRKKILALGLILASTIILVTLVTQLKSYFLLLLLLMIGSGAFHPAAAGLASNLSKDHKGKVILLFASGGAIGFAISQLTFSKLLLIFQGHAFILFIPLALLLILVWRHPFSTPNSNNQRISLSIFLESINKQRKPLLLLYFSQVTNQALFLAFIFLLPDFLQARGCHSWICGGGGHFCFIFSSALMMFPISFLCDKWGQKKILLTTLTASTLILYFFLIMPKISSTPWTIFLLCSLGAFLGIVNPVIVSWGNKLVPENPSTISALLMGFAWCFSHFGSLTAGIMAKYFAPNSYLPTLSILGSILILNFISISLIPNKEKRVILVQK